MISTLVLSTLLGLGAAQTTILTLPFIGYDTQSMVASGVGASDNAYTLQLGCPEGTDGNDCGLFPKQILVVGPSTYNMDMSDPNTDFTATQDCVVGTANIVCKETAGGSEANFPGSSTETYDLSSVMTLPVTVTAGVDKLRVTGGGAASSAVSSSADAASRSAPSASNATPTSAAGSGSIAPSSKVSQSGSAPATASTGAAVVNVVAFGGGLIGAAAGVFGGLLL